MIGSNMYRWLPVALLSLVTGCEYSLTQDTPEVTAVSPGLVCSQQLTTTVTVDGSMFRPMPTDVLAESPTLDLPMLSVTMVGDLVGGSATAEPLELTDIQWLDEAMMSFDVSPELAIAPGVYDFALQNPDGQISGLTAALAVAPRAHLPRQGCALPR
jgi:hypothetical protein